MARPDLNPSQQARMRELFAALGIKGELRKTARRHLRTTPEYAQAKAEGRARAWLDDEADSMADYLYEAMTTRMLEP